MQPQFRSTFLDELPVDSEEGPRLRTVENACASRVRPTPVTQPQLLLLSAALARDLGLHEWAQDREAAARVLAGNELLPGMQPYASCYGGHQFGSWAGQLGDGRAITLGELETPRGERWELQLKGAGPTPYSRRGDGRAVLRSSIREYLTSEAMHHLGIATTRALSLVSTGESVMRDMFYDGRARPEPGAIVCRAAPSFVRFGNFEIFAARDDDKSLRALADYTIRHFYSHLLPPSGPLGPETYLAFFSEVGTRTAQMLVDWMRVGFVHGVMNTDNMSILGLTIDYGPYGFIDDFDPGFTPNTTDASGRRYRYGAQPDIGRWNMIRLAQALYPLIHDVPSLERAIGAFDETMGQNERTMLLGRLGWSLWHEDEDGPFFRRLFEFLGAAQADLTLFFRTLSGLELTDLPAAIAALEGTFYADPSASQRDRLAALLADMVRRTELDLQEAKKTPEERREAMKAFNPEFIPRNYLTQTAIEAAELGDLGPLEELERASFAPYEDRPERAHLCQKRPEWARNKPGCSMLSCSS